MAQPPQLPGQRLRSPLRIGRFAQALRLQLQGDIGARRLSQGLLARVIQNLHRGYVQAAVLARQCPHAGQLGGGFRALLPEFVGLHG